MKTRPKQTDEDIVEKAVRERLWPEALKWLQGGGWDYGDDKDECENAISELVSACRYSHDGFQRAKDLSDWEPDMELCELLDGFSVYGTHQKAVEQWVIDEKPTQSRKVGDTVRVRENPFEPWVDGIIDVIDEKRANYTVRVPSKGHDEAHVQPTMKKSIVSHGWIVAWEDVRPTTGAEPSPSPG